MRNLLAGVVLLTAILTGSLIAGSPVHGDTTQAASTAGITLGTPASSSSSRVQLAPAVPRLQPSSVWLLLVALAGATTVAVSSVDEPLRPPVRWRRPSRRGPPSLV